MSKYVKKGLRKGPLHPGWKGGKAIQNGKIKINIPEHPRSDSNGYVIEAIVIAESALGKSLPSGSVVHHVDENPLNNTPSNLVICPSTAYHSLLHQRKRAYEACGHADWHKCWICKKYSSASDLTISKHTKVHKKCHAEYERNRKNKKLGEIR
jgi:hypothetical protein